MRKLKYLWEKNFTVLNAHYIKLHGHFHLSLYLQHEHFYPFYYLHGHFGNKRIHGVEVTLDKVNCWVEINLLVSLIQT